MHRPFQATSFVRLSVTKKHCTTTAGEAIQQLQMLGLVLLAPIHVHQVTMCTIGVAEGSSEIKK